MSDAQPSLADSHLLSMAGDMPGAATARLLAGNARMGTTRKAYDSHFAAFAEYCEAAGVSALPASKWTVFNYVGYLAEGGRWAADSLQPIFSAINAAHKDYELEPPASDNYFLSQARTGLRRAQVDAGHTRDTRIPLPCEVVMDMITVGERAMSELALALDGKTNGDTLYLLKQVRATFGLSLTALFAGRQDSGVHLRSLDFGVDAQHVWLRLSEKGKKGKVLRRVLKLSLSGTTSAVRRIARLGEQYIAARASLLRAGQALPEYLLQLPGEARPTTRSMEGWLAWALEHLGVEAPSGFAYLGHSIRSMGASAMAALGVPRHAYIFIGGWARGSTVVDKHYIDPTFTPSPAARELYGWLLAHAYTADATGTWETGTVLPDPWLEAG